MVPGKSGVQNGCERRVRGGTPSAARIDRGVSSSPCSGSPAPPQLADVCAIRSSPGCRPAPVEIDPTSLRAAPRVDCSSNVSSDHVFYLSAPRFVFALLCLPTASAASPSLLALLSPCFYRSLPFMPRFCLSCLLSASRFPPPVFDIITFLNVPGSFPCPLPAPLGPRHISLNLCLVSMTRLVSAARSRRHHRPAGRDVWADGVPYLPGAAPSALSGFSRPRSAC